MAAMVGMVVAGAVVGTVVAGVVAMASGPRLPITRRFDRKTPQGRMPWKPSLWMALSLSLSEKLEQAARLPSWRTASSYLSRFLPHRRSDHLGQLP